MKKLVIMLSIMVIIAQTATTQNKPGNRTQVLALGTFHFAQTGPDVDVAKWLK